MPTFLIVLCGGVIFAAIAFFKSPEFNQDAKMAVGILATVLSTILLSVSVIQHNGVRKKSENPTQINVNRS